MAGKEESRKRQEQFCRILLQRMDPELAGQACGVKDPYAMLASKGVQRRLERVRKSVQQSVTREDVIRRLAQLCFGGANDAAKLVLAEKPEAAALEEMELSAVSELKRGSNGVVEIKLLDRVKALSVLYDILSQKEQDNSLSLYDALIGTEEDRDTWQ